METRQRQFSKVIDKIKSSNVIFLKIVQNLAVTHLCNIVELDLEYYLVVSTNQILICLKILVSLKTDFNQFKNWKKKSFL